MRFRLRTLLIVMAVGLPMVGFAFAALRDGEAAAFGILVSLSFSVIASLTWYFAPRPRLFVRAFVPKDEWRDAICNGVLDPQFSEGMQIMAKLQFVAALWVGAAIAIGACFP
jgi:hypothetical protein